MYCKLLKNKEKYQFMSLLLQLAILHVRLFSSPGFHLHIARKQGLVETKMTFTSVFIFLAKMNSFAYLDITVEEISKIRNSRPKKSSFSAEIWTLSLPRSIVKMTTITTMMWVMNLKVHLAKEHAQKITCLLVAKHFKQVAWVDMRYCHGSQTCGT